MVNEGYLSASEWAKGIGYSILASIVGGASKLAIRKSWLIVQEDEVQEEREASENNHVDTTDLFDHETNSNSLRVPSSPYDIQDDDDDDDDNDGAQSQHSPLHPSHSNDSLHQRHTNQCQEEVEGRFNDDCECNISYKKEGKFKWFFSTNKQVAALSLRYSGMFGMTILNPLFCVLAMNYASPSILAPFSGLTLVWIILCSEYFISERPQRKQMFAASLIILGQVIVGVFGDHTNDDGITLEDM